MKKILTLIVLIVLIFSYVVVYADNNISITNIEIDDISDNTLVNKDPTVDGLSFSVDTTFFEVNDFIKYKIEVENSSSDDLVISDDLKFKGNDYITYDFKMDGESILKANSKKTLYVTATYTKEVDDNMFENNVYNNNGVMQLNLANLTNNPKTGHSNIVLSIISLIMIGFGVYMVIKYGKKDTALIIIMCLSLIPISVFALEQFKLKINANIVIEKDVPTFNICSYIEHNQCTTYRFKDGMTFNEWLTSKYNYNKFTFTENKTECSLGEKFLKRSTPKAGKNEIDYMVLYDDEIESMDYYTGIGTLCTLE